MVHNFFKRNKKKAVISTVILSLLALSVCVVCIYNSKILAGVFQSHKNEDGTMSYVEKNTIEILEIVAQNGQQVLGYTVEGSEPIKPEQIQSYTGNIDHDEFLNATGYDVTGTPGNYTVNSSHNNAFNENVLSDMMYAENDKIIVNAVMASALTEDDIESADLICINNPADNDGNLLYYYDQIVNNGRKGIQKGDRGVTYTGSIEEQISVKEYAVDKICKAAGRRINAEALTADDFKKAEAENFYDYNMTEYINGIAALKRDSLNGGSVDESVINISRALDTINKDVKGKALDVIKDYVKTGSIVEEDREKLIIAFKQRGYSNFYEINEQDYVDYIVSTKRRTDPKIDGGMNTVNDRNYKSAIKILKDIKDGVDKKGTLTDEEYTALVSKSIAQVFYNNEIYKKLNSEIYAVKFIEDASSYDTSENDVFMSDLENNIISVVNVEEKEKALTTLAALASDRTATDELKNNPDTADRLFVLSELENYKSFNLERYLDAIGDLTDDKGLVSNQENDDGTWSEKYSEDKINNLLKSVNDSMQTIGISCDISWNIAMKIYEYVTLNGRALIYNTELLTSNTIGEYTRPDGENNSNSMYKFLLVLRQMTPDYFRNTVLPRIDSDGNYDDGSGNVNGSWYAGTFCSNWNNEASADKHNFCEPSVVGKLYDTEGNQIGDSSYIKENIYCFTGNEFFGGRQFFVDSENYNKKIGNFVVTRKEYEEKEETKLATFQSGNTFFVDIPLTTGEMYYYLDNSSFDWQVLDRTYSFNVSDCPNGTIIKIKSPATKVGNTNYFNVEKIFPSSETAPSTGNTKRIYVDVSEIRYWKEEGTGNNFATYKYYEEKVVSENIDKTKGEIIREIMGISLNQLPSMPFKVLEIQPDGNVNEFNSYEGAVRLADYLRIDVPDMNQENYKDYFEVEPISIREFNTRHEELNGKYDLIYFGTKTKYISTVTAKKDNQSITRTLYNSNVMGEGYSMNGLVYTGIGPQREVGGSLRGTVASDYDTYTNKELTKPTGKNLLDHDLWTKYFFAEFSETGTTNYLNSDPGVYYYLDADTPVKTRMSGNDLTVTRMNDLLEYVKSGYPVLFADGIINDEGLVDGNDNKDYDSLVSWRYVDRNSKFYAFIQQAKALGKDSSGQYTDTKAFYDGKPYAGLVSVSYAKYGKNPDKLSAGEKFNGGLCFAVKRNVQVDFEYVKGPQEYDRDTSGNKLTQSGNTIGTFVTDLNSCKCVLRPNISRDNVMEWINENYRFRFLIDKSGTANFPENQTVELDVYTDFDEKKNEITVGTKKGKWPGGLDGFIPWKLVAESKSNTGNRWVYIGYSAFKKEEADNVDVLWVKAEASGNGAKDGTTLDFKSMMEKYQKYIPDYNIHIDTIYYKNFVRNWNNVSDDEKSNPYNKDRSRIKIGKLDNKENGSYYKGKSLTPEESNKEYDMIVIGFCDSYDNLDIDNIYCLNNIDYFVNKAGHSMLFAHDNASAITSFNYYKSNNTSSISFEDWDYIHHGLIKDFARYTTSFMRGMLGMDAYGSSYSPLAFNMNSTNTEGKDYLSWLYKYTPSLYNARSYITDNPQNPTQEELSDMRGFVDGQVLWYSTNEDNWPMKDEKGKNIGMNKYGEDYGFTNNWLNTKGIECTNKGQIAVYPFIIGDSLTIGSDTHFQYTKLDVESKDTTVWYTLANDKNTPYYDATKGDGSNNYYIYSHGNITYTGAGHRKIDDDSIECLLFVNTVVAAIKLGNFVPDVTFPEAIPVNNTDVLYGYEDNKTLKVTFRATDYDVVKKALDEDKNAFTDAFIFLDKDKDGKYNQDKGDILLNKNAGYMKDKDGRVINIDGTDSISVDTETSFIIKNREDMTFYLNYQDLASIYDEKINPGNSMTNDIDKVKDLFGDKNDYRICVSVLSKSERDKAVTAGDTAHLNDYYQSASAKVVIRGLHNLR